MPEETLSELTQIYYLIVIDMDQTIDDRFKPLIEMVKTRLDKQLQLFKDAVYQLAKNSVQRGVPIEDIFLYLGLYFDYAFSRVYPGHRLIL